MKKRILSLSLVAMFAAGLLLSGCGAEKGQTDDTNKDQSVTDQDPDALLKTIGVELTGENVYQVKLTNNTGKDIVGFSVKDSSQEAFPENLLAEDDVFANGEERILYYDATDAIEAAKAAQSTDANAPVLDPAYDVSLTFLDGEEETVLVLHAFSFNDMESGSILLEDDVAFVSYHSTVTDQDVSTKEAEMKIKANEEAAVQQQTTTQQPTIQQPVTQQPSTPQQPVVDNTPEPEQPPVDNSTTDTEDPGTNLDQGCIGDEGLVY